MSKTPSILIIGSNSFTGIYLSKYLTGLNWKVHNSSRSNSKNSIFIDLMDIKSIKNAIKITQPDYLINLAGITTNTFKDYAAIYNVNVVGTLNLLSAIREEASRIKNIVLLSSCNVYGNSSSLYVKETEIMKPINDYGISKSTIEMIASAWKDKLPINIIRPFNYTGLGQPDNFLIPKLISQYTNKLEFIELGNIDVIREFNDVRDVVAIFKLIIEIKSSGNIFNVCSQRGYCIKEILKILSKQTGWSPKILINKKFVRKNDIKRLVGSNEKLFKYIPEYKFKKIEETLSWMMLK